MVEPLLVATLPLPPSVNHLYHRFGQKVILTDAALAYSDQVALALRGMPAPGEARLEVTIRFSFPDRRRRDLDNALKLLLDAVSRALSFDDSQIDILHVFRERDPSRPRVELVIQRAADHLLECDR